MTQNSISKNTIDQYFKKQTTSITAIKGSSLVFKLIEATTEII